MENYYSIGEFSQKIGKTTQTLRNWDKTGKLKPAFISENGYRYYSDEQLETILKEESKKKKVIAYIKGHVDKPGELLINHKIMKNYLKKRAYDAEVLCDIDCGIRPTKKQILDLIQESDKNFKEVIMDVNRSLGMEKFIELIGYIIVSEVEKIILISEDNIPALDFPLFKLICETTNVEIEVICDDIRKNEVSDEVEYLSIFADLLSN